MHTIFSHSKSAFDGIISVGKKERLLWSAIVTFMVLSVVSAFHQIEQIRAHVKGETQITSLQWLIAAVAIAVLYKVGGVVIARIVKRHNAKLDAPIDEACSAVFEKTGIQIANDEMSNLIYCTTRVEPQTHVEKVDDIEYTLQFSAVSDYLTISYSAVVQHKTSPVSAKTVKASARS